MRTRTVGYVVGVVLSLAIAASVRTAAVRAMPAQRYTAPELKKAPGGGAGYTSWARSEVATGEGVRLTRTVFEKKYDGRDYAFIEGCPGFSSIPDAVSDNSSGSFCYGSFHPPSGFLEVDTGLYFYYDILVPDSAGGWKPSGYYVDAATKIPLFGEPRIDCSIKAAGSTTQAGGAPFKCEASLTGSGNDAKPRWKVTAKPVTVVDAATSANVARAAQLIGDNCSTFDTPRCSWTRTQKSSAFLQDRDDWQSLTNWADSCPPTDPNKPFVLQTSRSVQVSWSDKVGGKISGKIAGDVFVAKVEATVEANYEHSVSQSDTYGESYTYTIPYNYQAALYLQHGLLQVTGDFSIVDGIGDRYLVKNAVFQFPLQKDVQLGDRGQRVKRGLVMHADIPCSEKAPTLAYPPPPAGKIGIVPEKAR